MNVNCHFVQADFSLANATAEHLHQAAIPIPTPKARMTGNIAKNKSIPSPSATYASPEAAPAAPANTKQ